jgi:sensor domain CHASE-containing protein
MIKIFRKIRQQLLTENKFSKYLIYAIGEIILVVIGIMIALSINNWNEGRKKKETLNNIYTTIKQDLETDLLNIDKIFTQ